MWEVLHYTSRSSIRKYRLETVTQWHFCIRVYVLNIPEKDCFRAEETDKQGSAVTCDWFTVVSQTCSSFPQITFVSFLLLGQTNLHFCANYKHKLICNVCPSSSHVGSTTLPSWATSHLLRSQRQKDTSDRSVCPDVLLLILKAHVCVIKLTQSSLQMVCRSVMYSGFLTPLPSSPLMPSKPIRQVSLKGLWIHIGMNRSTCGPLLSWDFATHPNFS